jgi:chemotaxis methyl-accepting protein methylase
MLTNEICNGTELYLPIDALSRMLIRLCKQSLTYTPFFAATPFNVAASWPELLELLYPFVPEANPSTLIRQLLADDAYRTAFLFAAFVPRRFSGGFRRYPAQLDYIADWLRRGGFVGGVRCLDAACGTGEGTYDLLRTVMTCGVAAGSAIHGTTIEPLELAAAAHGLFPHDAERERRFRRAVAPLLEESKGVTVEFRQENLLDASGAGERYDLIVCNGMLWGPLLHGSHEIGQVLSVLVAKLRSGGLLVVADRFHGGWNKSFPLHERVRMLTDFGLRLVESGEGIGGIKP